MMTRRRQAGVNFHPGGAPQAPGAPCGQPARRAVTCPSPVPRVGSARAIRRAGIALALVPLMLAAPASVAHAQATTTALLARIARLEDSRGTQGHDLADVVALTSHAVPAVRAAAYRALGRQEDPRWLPTLYAGTHDRVPAVRIEATNGIGQVLQWYKAAPAGETPIAVAAAVDSLERAATAAGSSHDVAGIAARTIGRLPYRDAASARRAEGVIARLGATAGPPSALAMPRVEGALHGLYALARQRRSLGTPGDASLAFMRGAREVQSVARPEAAARVRRLALLGLSSAGAMDAGTVTTAFADRDDQVRRLAIAAESALGDSTRRREALRRGLADPSFLVRFEAARAVRAFAAVDGCQSLTDALGDTSAHVVLAAIDGLSRACRDRDRVATRLLALIDANRSDSPARAPGRSGWHVHAHALVALARTAPDRALPIVRRDAKESTFWALRTWIARAATQLQDTATLVTLAHDADPNVRALALTGLSTVAGHGADTLYTAGLAAREYQVVMAAAQGLAGSPARAEATAALLGALERLTAERRENTRDPREEILTRLGELGDASIATRVATWRTDYDSTIAKQAAALSTKWGQAVTAAPAALALPVEHIEPLLGGALVARFEMSPTTGGGSFDVVLFPREAPYTVARFVRLARAGWYNGRTFHRVEPAFVIQGGSPAANEYMGDGPFMRDEVGTRSHTRGTLGISTRGRDTGDAQLFVNLTDNFRLDHDYTVFGEITRGRDVAERVLEADVIERVTILRK